MHAFMSAHAAVHDKAAKLITLYIYLYFGACAFRSLTQLQPTKLLAMLIMENEQVSSLPEHMAPVMFKRFFKRLSCHSAILLAPSPSILSSSSINLIPHQLMEAIYHPWQVKGAQHFKTQER